MSRSRKKRAVVIPSPKPNPPTPPTTPAENTRKTIVSQIDPTLLLGSSKYSDRFVYSNSFIPINQELYTAAPGPAATSQDLTPLLKSEIGYLFLDRTRIRPKGFAIGEHVYSLSMAPGEEIILEQKNFSKREITYEEETQQEKQFDLELSSTLSTELQEGFQLQRNISNTTGFSVGGGANFPVKGVPVNVSLNFSNNTSEANNETKTRSLKESATTSSKVASKYRTLHKVTFKVSTEERFESTSKRTIRNPNRCTPIQLQFFKTLQTLELVQERYGVRLCWSPSVMDPGFDFAQRIELGKGAIMNVELESVQIPPKPAPPSSGGTKVFENSPPLDTSNKWGFFCDMRADFEVSIKLEFGYTWDENRDFVVSSIELSTQNMNRGYHHSVIGSPWSDGDTVKVKVHVGADGGPIGGCGKIFIKAKATGIKTPSSAELENWRTKMKEWQDTVSNLTQEAKEKGQRNASLWEQEVINRLNPIEEIIQRVVTKHFPKDKRDEQWEIDFWRAIFDWDSASYLLYPGWWSDLPMRDYTKDTTHFTNASWAKLYVPIKLGYERLALRWIITKSMTSIDPQKESIIGNIISDLNSFRNTNFGPTETTIVSSPTGDELIEKFLMLGRWNETLPTDGTHMEVIQGITNACDQHTKDEIEAIVKNHELKSKILSSTKAPAEAHVNVNMDAIDGDSMGS